MKAEETTPAQFPRRLDLEDYPGLTQNSIATFGPMKAAWFKDSEGNLLSLAEKPTMLMASPAANNMY